LHEEKDFIQHIHIFFQNRILIHLYES
jgi:hypothetical protein